MIRNYSPTSTFTTWDGTDTSTATTFYDWPVRVYTAITGIIKKLEYWQKHHAWRQFRGRLYTVYNVVVRPEIKLILMRHNPGQWTRNFNKRGEL